MSAAVHGKTRFSLERKGGQREGEGRWRRLVAMRAGRGAGLGCPPDVAMNDLVPNGV
jgi:hypothetical protein